MGHRSRLDDEVLDLLADEPELRAIADAIVETQVQRRRMRPIGIVAAVALVAAAVVAFAAWPGGGSHGISGNVAYAAMGGEARVLQLHLAMPESSVAFMYNRDRGQLSAKSAGRVVRVPATKLPPQATTVAPALAPFGTEVGLGVSLLIEYPDRAKAGKLEDVKTPPRGFRTLRWVSYRSAFGYVVQVGLLGAILQPVEVMREGARAPLAVSRLYNSN
jgi:hypothetical protein